MTGQNILDVSQTQGIMTTVSSKQSGKTSDTASGFFASFLPSGQNQKTDTTDMVTASKGQTQKLSYKDTQSIRPARNSPMEQKAMESKEVLDDASLQIKEVILDNTDLSEEELQEAMNILGLSYIDLLEPANLTQLVSQINQSQDPTEMLMNADFLDMLQGVNSIGTKLLNQLAVDEDSLREIIETMDWLENDSDAVISNPAGEIVSQEIAAGDYGSVEEAVEMDELTGSADDVSTYTETSTSFQTPAKEETFFSNDGSDSFDDNSSGREPTGTEHMTADFSVNNVSGSEETVVETENVSTGSSYSFDIEDVISQIVTRTRIDLNGADSTIEMELNPENLGKIYLNVTHSNGSVNAQITATNEAVREALEAQLVDLRENLNQAGIKVDAVEVTVETHAFEENLSQGFEREQEEARQRQEYSSGRRNINISELDELSGLMSEEETLAAQMMLDNGNSVDFSA